MVSTRGHPTQFPEPELSPAVSPTKSPSKRSASPSKRSVSASLETANGNPRGVTRSSSKPDNSKTSSMSACIPFARPVSLSPGVHTPPPLQILWLLVSLPLVIWDTGYVLLRPHTMAGGVLHEPIYTLYALYAEVDHTYGWPVYEAGLGFTAAQSAMNLVETVGYIWYLWIVVSGLQGVTKGGSKWIALLKGEHAGVKNCERGIAIGYAVSIMTVSKTVLYWLNEILANPPLKGLRHNDFSTLFWIFIVPNILWIIIPSYMAWVFWREIVGRLELDRKASESKKST